MADAITPFVLDVPQSELDDLAARFDRVRWPDPSPIEDGRQGPPLARIKALVAHWRTAYDWRRCESLLNGLGQSSTVIDGVEIHFLHVRSTYEDAMPLLMTHGWPGSVLEFRHVIDPLVNPTAHGGTAEDAFHLVIPSMRGSAFRESPTYRVGTPAASLPPGSS